MTNTTENADKTETITSIRKVSFLSLKNSALQEENSFSTNPRGLYLMSQTDRAKNLTNKLSFRGFCKNSFSAECNILKSSTANKQDNSYK